MSTVQEELAVRQKLDDLLADFERRTTTDTEQPGKIFSDLIADTPGLRASLLRTVEQGELRKFDGEPDARFNGTFDHNTGTLTMSIGLLNKADPNGPVEDRVSNANEVRFVTGHEVDHALSAAVVRQQGEQFKERVAAIANGPSPHDFTAVVKDYNNGRREREASAEIAGFNTVVANVKRLNPNATLGDLYNADGGLSNYIDENQKTDPYTYTIIPGLHIKPDLQLDEDKSLEAMAKVFYDDNPGYPARNIDWAFSEIYRQEALAQSAHPGRPFPEIRINVQELGAEITLPPDFKDTSPAQPGKSTPPVERSTTPGPNDPSHPDHKLLEKIRDSVRDLEQGVGKPWDDQSERLSASAFSMAVASKFGPGDDVKVTLNRPTEQNAAGELLFVYREGRNASPDPAANHAHMPVAQALSVPASERYEQAMNMRDVQAFNQQRDQQLVQEAAQQGQAQTGPRMQH
ncbi:XVIPCD domain-containing protein [Lysobacter sp. CA199]|uniref:XVIPCD domain-containing protein n=1 Tax=Lysobacter sp. CA199 TaxID=3455608 RepID=UPI003F8D2E30